MQRSTPTTTSPTLRPATARCGRWPLKRGPTTATDDRDELRRHLIQTVTSQRTSSSKDMDGDEWTALFDALESIKAGTHSLFLRSNGEWELRKNGGQK